MIRIEIITLSMSIITSLSHGAAATSARGFSKVERSKRDPFDKLRAPSPVEERGRRIPMQFSG